MDIRSIKPIFNNGKYLYIETYGCQMNIGDSELVVSIMRGCGYQYTEDIKQADVILVNTCSIRDNAEQRIWGRLKEFALLKRDKKHLVVGLIGCMAERLKEKLIKETDLVDVVVGPDAYRELPNLLKLCFEGEKGINVELSKEETYDDIVPVRLDKNGVTSFVSIMRGCNNFCSYCVVPYTRGEERSRDPKTILSEVYSLFEAGYKEVTLLGQNVNSYRWEIDGVKMDFPMLISEVAKISPTLRVRFSTSHPKDISDELIATVASYDNICKHIHLPAQSGNSAILQKMNRKYTREWYLERVAKIKELIPNCAISTDLIVGFSDETAEQHQDTLTLMREVAYEFAYMFKYSLRPNTAAERTMSDNVSEEEKTRRLTDTISLQRILASESNQRDVGKEFEVLVEGVSKRSSTHLFGRTTHNKVVVFPKKEHNIGDYVKVKVTECSSATLVGHSV